MTWRGESDWSPFHRYSEGRAASLMSMFISMHVCVNTCQVIFFFVVTAAFRNRCKLKPSNISQTHFLTAFSSSPHLFLHLFFFFSGFWINEIINWGKTNMQMNVSIQKTRFLLSHFLQTEIFHFHDTLSRREDRFKFIPMPELRAVCYVPLLPPLLVCPCEVHISVVSLWGRMWVTSSAHICCSGFQPVHCVGPQHSARVMINTCKHTPCKHSWWLN